jgi:hypothetical protein
LRVEIADGEGRGLAARAGVVEEQQNAVITTAFASTGRHAVCVEQREDGALIDQIVRGPDQYLTVPPGGRQDDATILTGDAHRLCDIVYSERDLRRRAQATWPIAVTSTCR